MSQITLAHEIGHNLGSPHDPEGRCSPGGSDGNFIMYPSATSGYRKNNPRFSPCSLASMSAAVDAVPNLFSECLKVRNMFLRVCLEKRRFTYEVYKNSTRGCVNLCSMG